MALSRVPVRRGLLKTTGISLVLHIAIMILLSINPWPNFIKVHPIAYTVTLMPLSIPEPQIRKPTPPPVIKEYKPKPIEKPKKDDIIEKVKEPKKEKVELKQLQEEIEEIRRKVALDEIQKRVARREKKEERIEPIAPFTPTPISSPSVSLRQTLPSKESKLNDYYSMIWAKIKEAWTIPDQLLKDRVDLEAVIVVIIDRDGKVQESWFEKKSGNGLYDQMAMRAIKKAEPLPRIPKEFKEKTLEIGIRFLPD